MRHPRHSIAFKRELVERSLQPGESVAQLTREQGVKNANQIFSWCKPYRAGLPEECAGGMRLLPVRVSEAATPGAVSRPSAERSGRSGRMVPERQGCRLIIEGQPDPVVRPVWADGCLTRLGQHLTVAGSRNPATLQ